MRSSLRSSTGWQSATAARKIRAPTPSRCRKSPRCAVHRSLTSMRGAAKSCALWLPVALHPPAPTDAAAVAPKPPAGFPLALCAQQLVDRAARLVDCRVGVCGSSGIRVCDRDPPEGRSADDVRALRFGHHRVEQGVVFRRIAMRPAINRDRLDVACRIEAARAECAGELLADLALEGREGSREQLRAAGFVLFELREPRLTGDTLHREENRLRGVHGAAVTADVDLWVESECRVIGARRIYTMHPEGFERLPVTQRDARVHERRFDETVQRRALRRRQLRT